jgi:hypothetical protein
LSGGLTADSRLRDALASIHASFPSIRQSGQQIGSIAFP